MADDKAPAPVVATPVQGSGVPVATVVQINQTGVSRGDIGYYDKFPRRIICQFCGYEVITGTEKVTGLGTHLVCLGLCCVGCIPCCILPYVMDDCKDVNHVCPNCHRMVGSKHLV